MANSGKVSIIMPAYNAEQFIASAIESVLGQTYKNIELIVIDDKSSDMTPEVIQRYSDADPRLIFVKNPKNLGISGATNVGLRIATGSYVAFQDNDDIMLPEKVEQCLTSLRGKSDHIGVLSTGTYVDTKDRSLGFDVFIPAYLHENPYMVRAFERSYIPTWSMFLIRERVQELLFDESIVCGNQDFDFFLRMLHFKQKIVYLNKPLIRYRLHANNHHKYSVDTSYIYRKHKADDISELYKNAGYSGFIPAQALGKVCLSQGDYQRSQGYFEQALESAATDDELFIAYFMSASVLFERTDYVGCLKMLKKALGIKVLPELYNNIGVCERILGASDGDNYFFRAIDMFSGYGDANKNIESEDGIWYTKDLIRSVYKR
jgi:glycosyltransferase involved in cell wall biosynthesis